MKFPRMFKNLAAFAMAALALGLTGRNRSNRYQQ
jgi:hypothetical protein